MAANVLSFSGLAPFVVTRQVVGGAALEEMRLGDRPAVFTVAGHAVEAAPAETPGPAEVERPRARDRGRRPGRPGGLERGARARPVRHPEVGPRRRRRRSRRRQLRRVRRPAGADRAGRRLARASRGWSPRSAGGRTTSRSARPARRISPDLYIPCGISGAIQHWAGCSSAKAILAINTDPDAPMVTKASYAVIGDLHEVVPAINAEIRRRRGA